MRKLSTILVCSVFFLGPVNAPAATVKRAYRDGQTGPVHVVYSDGRDVAVPKERGQVSTEPPRIAPDRQTVGWAVDFPNYGTSYPIPLVLVIYRSGHILQRIGDALAIYKWQFVAGGRRIAVSSGTVHGWTRLHFTLYDSRTGRRLKVWDGEENSTPPEWGASLVH